jgi:hypothetical protein
VKRILPLLVFAATAIFNAIAARGQTSIPINSSNWSGFELYFPFREGAKWGLYTEGYLKRANFIKDPMGVETSLGVTYYLKNENRISGGFTYAYNDPYDAVALPYSWPDYRLWQQYMIRKAAKKNNDHLWVQRYRLEERWFYRKSDPTSSNFDYPKYEMTLRCMLRSQWYIKPRFGLVLYDEVHLRVYSQERDQKYLDQNRIYGGIIYALDDHRRWRIESGYMFQSQWESPDSEVGRERINNILRITLTGDIPLKN